ncbi:site-specific integrase [Ancylobacter sp. Lp-2]|uniref:tyrosine-type recombinase/integrase n=1 Tax=Ancylobacter sp. Lp-2 TaxID=2881339 RepID=UPI001E2D5D26|nr:site-specific integrase [Ancylobacter sp. Lp-2]
MAALQPAEKPYIAFDATLKGFGVRVMPTGAMSYIVEYRPGSGGRSVAKRRVTVGQVGPAMSPEDARKAARDLLAGVLRGEDPAAGRTKERAMPSFAVFADTVLTEAEAIAEAQPDEAHLRPGTLRNYRSLMRQHLGVAIGSMKLDAITQADVAKLHRKVGKEMPVTANRCLELIGSIFKEAGRQGLVTIGHNPAKGIPAFKEHNAERFLSDDELGRLGDALRVAEDEGIPWDLDPASTSKHVPKVQKTRVDPDAANVIRLLIFTGARLREILHAQWENVDLQRGFITSMSKTGRRHIFLPPAAVEILAGMPRRDAYVFPGTNSTAEAPCPRADINRPWRAVRKFAGLEDIRLHDLRHSYAATAAGNGASLHMIGKLLGHASPKTTARYAHLAHDPMRDVAERAAGKIAAAMGAATSGNEK